MFASDNVVLGLGDGGAHYGMICDASYSTFSLTHWTRDRAHGRRSIEDMIHRLTRQPAMLVGLKDRGLLAPGHRAHVNVIDYDRLALHKPTVISDLPAGGRRLNQEADGYVATIVHGKPIMRGGELTREVFGDRGGQRLEETVHHARVRLHQGLGLREVFRAAAFDEVTGQRPRRTSKP